jgi:2-oxoglutarate ferredoxin oxidoreductase subunit delta
MVRGDPPVSSAPDDKDPAIVGPDVIIDSEMCKGCNLCTYVCPTGVLIISESLNHLGFHPADYTGEGCTGCGVCFYACPEFGAITVYKPPKKPRQQKEEG